MFLCTKYLRQLEVLNRIQEKRLRQMKDQLPYPEGADFKDFDESRIRSFAIASNRYANFYTGISCQLKWDSKKTN